MLYLFCDERYEELPGKKRIIFCCIGFLRETWISQARDLMRYAQTTSRRDFQLEQIEEILACADGQSILSYADIPTKKVHNISSIPLPGVPDISPWNLIWSSAMSISIVPVIAKFDFKGHLYRSISIFYDSKTLNEKHRTVAQEAIKLLAPQIRAEKIIQFNRNLNMDVSIRRIEQISKAPNFESATPRQLGVSLADRLCSRRQFDAIGNRAVFSRISKSNVTHPVLMTYDMAVSHGRKRNWPQWRY